MQWCADSVWISMPGLPGSERSLRRRLVPDGLASKEAGLIE